MPKWPTWNRNVLSERQLVGEERRLEFRSLTPEQVRADLIRAAAHHDGDSRAQRLAGLADSIEVSPVYVENALGGRVPLGEAILDGLYGAGRGNSLPMAWTGEPADWGPMAGFAAAAGLISPESVFTNPEPGAQVEPPPVSTEAPVAETAGHDPDAAAAAAPAAGQTSAPPPEPIEPQRGSQDDQPEGERGQRHPAGQPARDAAGAPAATPPDAAPLLPPEPITLHLVPDPADVSPAELAKALAPALLPMGNPFEPALRALEHEVARAMAFERACENALAEADARLKEARGQRADALTAQHTLARIAQEWHARGTKAERAVA